MNLSHIKEGLKEFDQLEVATYLGYLKHLEKDTDKHGKLRNPWVSNFSALAFISLYKQVAKDKGLYIDGTTITLQYKGKVVVSYNFQAYKNKLLSRYPETLFDMQLVHAGDKFVFNKKDGKVNYTHTLLDPFNTGKKIIGAYCIIKNKRGEFIEVLNDDDITKMRNVAKHDNIWQKWYGEMVYKSVIKRACKRHFNDLVTNIETLDNENYNLDLVDLDHKIKDQVQNAENLDELSMLYDAYKDEVENEVEFINLLSVRKAEILAANASA